MHLCEHIHESLSSSMHHVSSVAPPPPCLLSQTEVLVREVGRMLSEKDLP